MGVGSFFKERNQFSWLALVFFALIGVGFVFGTLEVLEDSPELFLMIPFGIAILGLCAVNFISASSSAPAEGYGIADLLAWTALIIFVLFLAAQIYAEEFSGGELRINEETANLALYVIGLAIFAALLVPAKWAIGSGSKKPAAAKGRKKAKTVSGTTKAVSRGGNGITDAIMLPFRNIVSLIVGFVLSATGSFLFIPLVPLLGYAVRAAKQSCEKGSCVLPAWDDWGDLFKKGFAVIVISIIFFLPLIIYTMNFVSSQPFPEEDMEKPGALVGGLWLANADPVFNVLLIVTEFILAMALVFYAVRGSFGAAFSFGEIFKKIFNVEYIKAWIAIAIYFVVLMVAIQLVFGGIIEAIDASGEAPPLEVTFTLFGLYIVLQMFAVYLAMMSQMAAFGLHYKNTE